MEFQNLQGVDVAHCIASYREQFMEHIPSQEETAQTLSTLVEAGIPFWIVTNGSAIQRHKIERLGLGRLTSCIFISDVFGCQKPDARIYLAAASCLNAEPPLKCSLWGTIRRRIYWEPIALG